MIAKTVPAPPPDFFLFFFFVRCLALGFGFAGGGVYCGKPPAGAFAAGRSGRLANGSSTGATGAGIAGVGVAGAAGRVGCTGLAGDTGFAGDAGFVGDAGAAGAEGLGARIAKTWAHFGHLTLPDVNPAGSISCVLHFGHATRRAVIRR